MWNGCDMIWKHISALYYADLDQGLHQLPKITPDHINLTSFSKMKVNLAAQVFSGTVALARRRFYIDCLNVRSTSEHTRKRNDFLAPYFSPDDQRFNWLQNTFLVYLQEWLTAIQQRTGNFSKYN